MQRTLTHYEQTRRTTLSYLIAKFHIWLGTRAKFANDQTSNGSSKFYIKFRHTIPRDKATREDELGQLTNSKSRLLEFRPEASRERKSRKIESLKIVHIRRVRSLGFCSLLFRSGSMRFSSLCAIKFAIMPENSGG